MAISGSQENGRFSDMLSSPLVYKSKNNYEFTGEIKVFCGAIWWWLFVRGNSRRLIADTCYLIDARGVSMSNTQKFQKIIIIFFASFVATPAPASNNEINKNKSNSIELTNRYKKIAFIGCARTYMDGRFCFYNCTGPGGNTYTMVKEFKVWNGGPNNNCPQLISWDGVSF